MLVLLMGPSGCGKTSVIRKLGYPELMSTTSREPREDEAQGVDYCFLSKSEFRQKLDNGEFIEHTEYANNLYGFQRDHADKSKNSSDVYIAAVDYKGTLAMKEYLGDENVFAISIWPNTCNLIKWMTKRGDSEEKIEERISHMRNSNEIGNNNDVADIIVDGDGELEDLTKNISNLIIERLRTTLNGSKKLRTRD